MKNKQFVLTSMAFVFAIGGAFATRAIMPPTTATNYKNNDQTSTCRTLSSSITCGTQGDICTAEVDQSAGFSDVETLWDSGCANVLLKTP